MNYLLHFIVIFPVISAYVCNFYYEERILFFFFSPSRVGACYFFLYSHAPGWMHQFSIPCLCSGLWWLWLSWSISMTWQSCIELSKRSPRGFSACVQGKFMHFLHFVDRDDVTEKWVWAHSESTYSIIFVLCESIP